MTAVAANRHTNVYILVTVLSALKIVTHSILIAALGVDATMIPMFLKIRDTG